MLPSRRTTVVEYMLADLAGLHFQAGTEAESAWAMLESPPVTAAIGGVLARLRKHSKFAKL
jgi:hypothetical protein